MSINNKTLDYYLKLITSEYQNSPKFLQLVTNSLNKSFDIENIALVFDSDFDIDNAIGNQLEILGAILGQGRTVNFNPTDGSSSELSDDNYRNVLKAKILINQWDGVISSLLSNWKIIFPDITIIVIDNQDMTMDIIIGGTISSILKDLILNGYIVPKPQGVGINYTFGSTPFFGYGLDNNYVSGYKKGIWVNATEHPEFAYDQNGVNYSGYDKGYWKE